MEERETDSVTFIYGSSWGQFLPEKKEPFTHVCTVLAPWACFPLGAAPNSWEQDTVQKQVCSSAHVRESRKALYLPGLP